MKELVGIYTDEEELLVGAKKLKENGVKLKDCYSPCPIHGIDDVLDLKRSRIPVGGFFFGLTGTLTAFSLQTYTMWWAWQNDIGGKPFFPFPSFVPVLFELTVLFSAIGMVVSYCIINGLHPGAEPKLYSDRQTSDRFVLVVEPSNNVELISKIFKETGTEEIKEF